MLQSLSNCSSSILPKGSLPTMLYVHMFIEALVLGYQEILAWISGVAALIGFQIEDPFVFGSVCQEIYLWMLENT